MGSISKMTRKLPNPFKQLVFNVVPFSWRYGSKYRELSGFLNKSQWWSTQRLLDYQYEKLIQLLDHAYKNVPYYKNVFNERDIKPKDITSVSDLKKLPFLTKDIIRNNFKDLIATNIPSRDVIKLCTSGSMGSPLAFIAEKTIYQVEAAFIARIFSSQGVDLYGENSVWLRRYVPENGAPIYKYDQELKRMYLSAYDLSMDTLEEYVKIINSTKAKILVGYPSSLYILALFLAEANQKLENIRVLHASSEQFPQAWREKIEKVMGIRPKDHYGMMEKVSLFHRCSESDNYHENLEYGVTELVNKRGNTAEIVGTSLFNYAMPFIRYKTTDLAVSCKTNTNKCSCGRGLPLIVKEFEGRKDDFITTPDGRFLPGVNFYTLMYHIPGIDMFKIIQYSSNEVETEIVVNGLYTDHSKKLLMRGLLSRLGKKMQIRIKKVAKIDRNLKTGKIRCIENLYLRSNKGLKNKILS